MASTKVRGITIELGADTTGLSKALSSINKEIGTTQKELKDVERLLKLDPTNTELLHLRKCSELTSHSDKRLESEKHSGFV